MASPHKLVSNLRGRLSGRNPQYSAIPQPEDGQDLPHPQRGRGRGAWGPRRRTPLLVLIVGSVSVFVLFLLVVVYRYVHYRLA